MTGVNNNPSFPPLVITSSQSELSIAATGNSTQTSPLALSSRDPARQIARDRNARARLFPTASREIATGDETVALQISPLISRISSVDLTRKNYPLSTELKQILNQFVAATASSLRSRRTPAVKYAHEELAALANKNIIHRSELLKLISISEQLQGQSLRKNADVNDLRAAINSYLPTALELQQDVLKLARSTEENLSASGFSEFLLEHHGDLVDRGANGELMLTPSAAKQYASLQAEYRRTSPPHILSTSQSRVSVTERAVREIIDTGYRSYQTALRNPTENLHSKKYLIGCASIVEQLATVNAEKVTKERVAMTFPGGIKDPAQLNMGESYQENGFVFVGGERPSDNGFRMKITLDKAFQVDARRFYGQPVDESERKLQWISLPGGKFRFNGTEDRNGECIYLFSRQPRPIE